MRRVRQEKSCPFYLEMNVADHEFPELLLIGKIEHPWSCMGTKVVFNLFPVGVNEEIRIKTSGLDQDAKSYVSNNLTIAHALVSVDNYTFGGKFEEKIEFVRSLQDPIRDLFVEEYRKARLKQYKLIEEKQKTLGKSLPEQT